VNEKKSKAIENAVYSRGLPSLLEFAKSIPLDKLKLTKYHQRVLDLVAQTNNMIDVEKLIAELQKRANKCKVMAKEYKDLAKENESASESKLASRYDIQATIYNEIIYDIRKGKFNVKK
jgi:hypothetical protein